MNRAINPKRKEVQLLSAKQIAENYPLWAIEVALFIKRKYKIGD